MKKVLIYILMLQLIALSSHAWIKPNSNNVYTFKFKLSGESFSYSEKSNSFETVYKKAAQACFNHFSKKSPLTEDRGLDIIDVCANPRS